jgi:competence protein ComEC
VTTSTGASLVLHTEKVYSGRRTEAVTGDVMLYVAKGELTFHRGDRIRCITRISIPRLLGLPGEFDFQRFLYFQGVAAIGRVSSQQEIVLIRSAVSETPLRRIDLVAENLSEFIRTTIGDNDVSAVLTALLIGDQKRISPQLADAYTRAGVNHILSVSGFHVGIIAYFIISFVLLLASFSEKLALGCDLRRTVLVLTVPAMLLYLVLTGSAPATARSVIMLTVFVAALCAERETDPINALLFSAFILLSLHPPTLFDISFQLSFLALWGIVVIVPQVMGYIGLKTHSWRYSLAQFFVASCAASIATLVPVLFVFNQASLNGIFSNILIVPLLGYGAVLIGFCALPFMYLYHPLAKLLIHIAAKIVELSNWLVVQFSHLPVIHFYGITAIHMALFLACMVVLTFVRNKSVKLISCVTCVGVGVVVQLNMPSAADGHLHVTMLSVGQAESVLLRLPDGKTMLVDGGGYLHENGRDFGERILAPALLKLGVRKIDHFIMTHSHPDHIGGFPYLARTMDIGRFWESVSGGSGDDYMQLRANLANRKVPIERLTSGDHIALPAGISLHVLSPHASSGKTEAENDEISMNEESLVFRLVYGDFSMLFTADAGIPVETRLVAAGDSLKSSVLKVGHHGSRYSHLKPFLIESLHMLRSYRQGMTTALVYLPGVRLTSFQKEG